MCIRDSLDTGASISTVSEAYHRKKLSHLPVQPLQDFLHIECADGETLPYSSYIAADITAPGVGLGEKHSQPCLLLVVRDSRYNAKVPVLLGTNILEQFLDMSRETLGHRFGICRSAAWSSERRNLPGERIGSE